MSWTYSGRPDSSSLDAVRFLSGDKDIDRKLVSNEEIEFSISRTSDIYKAAAMVCRAVAAEFSTKASYTVGDVSKQCSDISKAFAERAKELDNATASSLFVLPSFGGLSRAEKDGLESNTDAVQPVFTKDLLNKRF